MTVEKAPDLLTERDPDEVVTPACIDHWLIKTTQKDAMRDFYVTVLGVSVTYSDDTITLLSFDDRYHRIALYAHPQLQPRPYTDQVMRTAGIDHIAYEYQHLDDLLQNYVRVKRAGIEPYWTVNHGPVTSFFYRDPEGIALELLVDNFNHDVEVTKRFLAGPFGDDPMGTNFDPEKLLAERKAGASPEELARRTYAGALA
jgi:catechol-2,3-dioxygenase